MKKYIRYFTALMAISALAACSNAPSDSDVKKAFLNQKQLNGCKYASLDDFTRINGIKGDTDKDYRISYKATVLFHYSVLQDFEDKFAQADQKFKAFNADIEKQKQEISTRQQAAGDTQSAIIEEIKKRIEQNPKFMQENTSWNQWAEIQNRGKKYNDERNVLTTKHAAEWDSWMGEQNKITEQANEKLNEGCTNPSRFNIKLTGGKSVDKTLIYTEDHWFIKTENGWMMNL